MALDNQIARAFISIHAPRTGSDVLSSDVATKHGLFQSTLPARGATRRFAFFDAAIQISIHAPRTGSDAYCANSTVFSALIFQSTLPARGATGQGYRRAWRRVQAFQSTLPARGATAEHP